MITRSRTLFVFSLVVVIALGGAVGYALYLIRAESQSASALANQADSLSGADTLDQSIRSAEDSDKADLSTFSQAVLTQAETVPLIELIESTGDGMGLKTSITSVSTDPSALAASSTPTATPVHIAVETNGSWAASMQFLHAIESLPYRVGVDADALTLSGGAANGWHGSLTVSVYTFN